MKNYYLILMPLIFVFSTNSSAKFLWEDFKTPKLNEVVAQTTKPTLTSNDSSELDLVKISSLLDSSEKVGNSEVNIGFLKTVLKQRVEQNPSADVNYLYAKVLQKEHAFDLALTVLRQNNNSIHINSQLLAANLLMTKGKFVEAKRHCLSLLGLTSIETAATCALDAESHAGNAQKSFEGLKQLITNKEMSFNTRHVLAELALRVGKPQQTLRYLREIDLNAAPVSMVVLWSDANLKLGQFERLLNVIPALVTEHSNLEDALLLRLAMAEARIGQSTVWQSRIDARVRLREQRQDTFHASDLALYYLEINENKEKARYWAEVNWQQAKLNQDRILLERANALFEPAMDLSSIPASSAKVSSIKIEESE